MLCDAGGGWQQHQIMSTAAIIVYHFLLFTTSAYRLYTYLQDVGQQQEMFYFSVQMLPTDDGLFYVNNRLLLLKVKADEAWCWIITGSILASPLSFYLVCVSALYFCSTALGCSVLARKVQIYIYIYIYIYACMQMHTWIHTYLDTTCHKYCTLFWILFWGTIDKSVLSMP